MSNDTELIESLRRRVSDPRTRTDHPESALPALPAPATAEAVAGAEEELGFRLPELLARLYVEIANGGFGPGFGVIGLPGGYLDDGRSIVALYRELKPGAVTEWHWPDGLLPICDWGCAILSCIDCRSPDCGMIFSEETELTRIPYNLTEWLEAWCRGERLWDQWEQMFDWEEVSIIDPFTRKPMIRRRRVRPARESR
jgi:hypothetical protein